MRRYLVAAILAMGACGGDDGGTDAVPVVQDLQISTAEDTPVMATLDAHAAGAPTLTITLSGPQHGTVERDGLLITYTPEANYNGTDRITVEVANGGATANAVIDIDVTAVNDAPAAGADSFATPGDTPLVLAASSLLTNDTDVDGDALSVTSVGTATHGTVALSGTTVTFTPAASYAGPASFEYTVSDGNLTAVGTVTITVSGVNHAPVATDDAATTNEDTPATLAAATLLGNDSDSDGQTLMITQVGNATNGTVGLSGTTVTFTPTANFNGTASFEYTVSDGSLTDVGLVTVTVAAVNDAPVAVDDAVSGTEDTATTIAAATLLANDSDLESASLVITQVGNATNGAVSLSGTTITFTPTANYNGAASFEYTVSDGALTDVGVVTVTVGAVNDAPVAADDTVLTDEDVAKLIDTSTLLANDSDVDSTPTITQVKNATNGSVSLAGTTITFTPSADFNGTASFDYTLSDGALTDTGHVTVTVGAINDAPLAADDAVLTDEDIQKMISASSLLANDSDVDSTPTITQVKNAMNGSVSLSGTTITFTPSADFNGTASFDYTLSDGALTDTGHVTVTVGAINDAPVAADDAVLTDEDIQKMISASSLLANDSDVDSTPTITQVKNAMNGSVSLSGTTITFTPSADFNGTASFDYTLSDGTLTDTGHVTVTVGAINDAPVAVDDAVLTDEDVAKVISASTLLANDTDVDGPSLTVSAVQNAVNGNVALDGTTITFTPSPDFSGTASFEYVVTDGTLTDVGVVTVTVAPTAVVCDTTAFPGADSLAVEPSNGHCYASYDDEMTTFADAEAACVAIGGHLATITSSAESTTVQAVMNQSQNPWIGAIDDANDTNDVFAWVTGETFLFKNFAPGQPDDDAAFGGNGECLHLVNALAQWNDTNCTLTTFVIGRICEIEPQPCGDGVLQTAFNGEECDDHNRTPGDGCSATCQLENGCGNGTLDGGEQCDDDNLANGDGCSATCQRELVSIAITPVTSAGNIALDQQQRVQMKAIGTFGPPTIPAQQSTSDVTSMATWLSSNMAVALVGTGGTNNGRVDALTLAGTTTVSATIGSVSGNVTVNVGATTCHPTINEVQASGATAADEWVELYNGCTTTFDVTGWTLTYRSATNLTATDTATLQTLAGAMTPGQFRLYASSSASGGTVAFADGTWTLGGSNGELQAASAGIGLRNGAASTGTLVDAVAYGSVTVGHPFIESTPAPQLSTSLSIGRSPFDGRDSNGNGTDFVLTNPAGNPATSPTPKTTNFP